MRSTTYVLIMNTCVQTWFGNHFDKIHPALQQLHTNGGVLHGDVRLEYGQGVAGIIGKRLGKKLGLPLVAGISPLTVTISHDNDQLVWARKFGDAHQMVSKFTYEGHYPDGYWLEKTNSIVIELGVDIEGGGWRWSQRKTRLTGVAVPNFLIPQVKAGKFVEEDGYQFYVEMRHPWCGLLLKYSGLLAIA